MGCNISCVGLRGKEGVFCNFGLLFLAMDRSLEISRLNWAMFISTSAWRSSILREVDKGAEQESTCRGRPQKEVFSLLKIHVV